MDKLLSSEVLPFFLMFAVPGVVAQRVYSSLVAVQPTKAADAALEILTFSMIHVGLFHGIYAWALQDEIAGSVLLANGVRIALVTLLPALEASLGVKLLKFLGSRGKVIHPTPKSWDFVFSSGRSFWVVLTMKNGQRLGGYYGPDSFSSSFPNPEQIYLQEVWSLDEGGRLVSRVNGTAGTIVNFSECLFLEFLEVNHERQTVVTEANEAGRLPAGQEGLPANAGTAALESATGGQRSDTPALEQHPQEVGARTDERKEPAVAEGADQRGLPAGQEGLPADAGTAALESATGRERSDAASDEQRLVKKVG